jgi:hypothetical protein
MPHAQHSPLNQGHLDQIKAALNHINTAEQQLELMKRAGVPLGEYEKQIAEAKVKLTALRNTYFPGEY